MDTDFTIFMENTLELKACYVPVAIYTERKGELEKKQTLAQYGSVICLNKMLSGTQLDMATEVKP